MSFGGNLNPLIKLSEYNWHSLNNEEVLLTLESNVTDGLSHHEASERLKIYGSNTLPKTKKRSYFAIILHQFLSPLIYLLLAAAAIAFIIGDSRDALVILVVVLLNAIIGAIQEGRAEQSMDALRQLSKLQARIIRGGQEQVIEASDLVPGDLLILNSGDAVSADARLLEVSSLTVAEAALTGESHPVAKSLETLDVSTPLADRHNMVYAGTHITAGRAHAIVIASGINNEIGKIANLTTAAVQPKTQLEQRIIQFGNYLLITSVVLFVLVISIGIYQGISFPKIFMIAISQMVSLVPEGLPVAMTIALAVGVQRMSRRGTIVRRLAAVETLGSTTIICTDKTGTLTRNEMVVTSLYLLKDKKEIIVSGVGYAPEGSLMNNGVEITHLKDANLHELLKACVLCNDAQLLAPEDSSATWKILGDPTEGALLTLAAKNNLDADTVRKKYPRIAELAFNSDAKMMATEHEIEGKKIVYIKGAPEAILNLSGLDQSITNEILSAAQKMADQALRVLAFGYAQDCQIDGDLGFKSFAGKITFIGIGGMLDPPRIEVSKAIAECKSAGIKTIMVTGDHKSTGLAIARALGISQENNLAIDGLELDQLSDHELSLQIDRISIFARVHPAQKLRIVKAYQNKGEVVAMTGDGVNDAPALVSANVGVAMGITGTEVAKEAAKIVITDDNFATIVAAIAEGRLVYQNIKKLILFLFITSIDEVVILFLALILGYSPPFAAVQILWINLVTEGALTVNLIMEPPEGNEMQRPPTAPNEPLLDRALVSRIPLMVLASVVSTFGWFIYRSGQGVLPNLVQTETFTVLAVCQWFNVLNCRSNLQSALTWNVIKNPWLIGGLFIANALHVAVIYWPPLNDFFHTVPINGKEVIAIGVVASLVIWVEEVRKFIARRFSHQGA